MDPKEIQCRPQSGSILSTNQLIYKVPRERKRASHLGLVFYWLNYWQTLISKDTSGFMSNTKCVKFEIS